MNEGLQVLSSNCYQRGLLLRGVTARVTSLGETQVEQLSMKAATLGGRPCHSQKSVGTWDKWESKRRYQITMQVRHRTN